MSEALRLASVLSAGVSPKLALEALGEEKVDPELLDLLEDAKKFGAPLAPICREFARYEESRFKFNLEISQAQAVPIATRKLMLWLPAFALALGQVSGLNTISALSSLPGLIILVLAGLLIWAGANWSRRLLDSTLGNPGHPGKDLILFRMGLDAGLGLSTCMGFLTQVSTIGELVEISRKTGSPIRSLVSSEIEALIRQRSSEAIQAAHKLSVSLVVPLSLTVLPAFLILTVFPMILGITNTK